MECMLRKLRYMNEKGLLTSTMSSAGSEEQRKTSTVRPSPAAKLPNLEISKFGGEIQAWQGFWGQFDSTIRQNETLYNIKKFKYLKRYLTGKGAVAIEGLAATTENYGGVDSKNVNALRELYDEAETVVRTLEVLGVRSNIYGTMLLTVLRRAIPSELTLEYNRRSRCTNFDRERRAARLSRLLKDRDRKQREKPVRTRPSVATTGIKKPVCVEVGVASDDAGFLGQSPSLQQFIELIGITDKEENTPRRVLLQTTQAWAEGMRDRCLIGLLTDGESQRTFTRRDVSQRLHLKELCQEDLTIFTFGGDATATETKCKRKIGQIEALNVLQMCSDAKANPSEELEGLPDGKKLTDVQVQGTSEKGIGVLIGADHYWDVVSGGVKRLGEKLVAVDTILGWPLQGPVTSTSAAICSLTTGAMKVTVSEINDEDILTRLRAFWELEHIRIPGNATKTSETKLLSEFKKSVEFQNER
ncbi:hypothetical protein HPB47_019632 [Ixodes persulcatus]|uniref:Uncharacterized protein n=1 Tax=Ixodes persulcatus TaxID=34615 RepID=A0AC60QHN1_IXOPE|nr:hypothetical protein HPB47_019632 [Ixodes persulcatus]